MLLDSSLKKCNQLIRGRVRFYHEAETSVGRISEFAEFNFPKKSSEELTNKNSIDKFIFSEIICYVMFKHNFKRGILEILYGSSE